MNKFRLVELAQLFSLFTAPKKKIKLFYFVVINDYANILIQQHKDLMSNVL